MKKKLAHKLGLWHEVFTCIVFNPKRNTVILQIKNHFHNNIHENDLIEITVGGHFRADETIEDGIRELHEETGLLDTKFADLIPIGVRQVATTVNENYIVREFQNIFLYPSEHQVIEFKSMDDEASCFTEFNIDELIALLLNKRKNVIGNTGYEKKKITLDNFVKSYLERDKLYLRLLIACKRYINNEDRDLLFY